MDTGKKTAREHGRAGYLGRDLDAEVLGRLAQVLHGRNDVGENDGHRGLQVLLVEADTVQNLRRSTDTANEPPREQRMRNKILIITA